jgi:hypothetical protein
MTRPVIVGALVLIVLAGLSFMAVVAFFFGKLTGTRPPSEIAVHEAQTDVLNFLDDIHEGNQKTAYERTSKAFRGRQTQDQFAGWIDRHPALRQALEHNVVPKGGSTANSIRFEVTLGEKSRPALQLSITVVKEGDNWKVDALSVP